MASRKKLKKGIGMVCGDLVANCTVLNLCGINDREKTDALLKKILELHIEYVSRISHTEKGSERLFYKKLREEFTRKAAALEAEINA